MTMTLFEIAKEATELAEKYVPAGTVAERVRVAYLRGFLDAFGEDKTAPKRVRKPRKVDGQNGAEATPTQSV